MDVVMVLRCPEASRTSLSASEACGGVSRLDLHVNLTHVPSKLCLRCTEAPQTQFVAMPPAFPAVRKSSAAATPMALATSSAGRSQDATRTGRGIDCSVEPSGYEIL